MLADFLRQQTRSVHDRIDHSPAMLAILNGTAEDAEVETFVVRQKQWIAGAYSALLATDHAFEANGFDLGKRVEAFAKAVGRDLAGISCRLPAAATLAFCGGWIYTAEGSLRGAVHINRVLSRRGYQHPLAYTHPTGVSAQWWEQTQVFLSLLPETEQVKQQALAGALDAFSAAEKLFCAPGSLELSHPLC